MRKILCVDGPWGGTIQDISDERNFYVEAGGEQFEYPDIFIKKLEIANSADQVFSTNTIPVGIWQKAVTAESAITVTIE
ncbi:hypothetical protein KDV51_07055 [Citrobacter portucalensis]|uniref:hypothetical protein n=1 Tax=Citrobacter portucalensis TaxID=1639133 RepID=UPI003335053A